MPGKVVPREEWLAARKALLAKEKEHTRAGDALAAERRDLPMVKVDKAYAFTGPDGETVYSLADLFAGRDQLIVYHFMFGPEDKRGCAGCSHIGESLPDARHLRLKNTNLVCVSRAPADKLEAFRREAGWTFPWYSCGPSAEFNLDFHATIDEDKRPVELNFRTKEELAAAGREVDESDVPGFSVFLKRDGEIYHTYSAFTRGAESVMSTLALLDMTPLGRQLGVMGPAEFKLKHEYRGE